MTLLIGSDSIVSLNVDRSAGGASANAPATDGSFNDHLQRAQEDDSSASPKADASAQASDEPADASAAQDDPRAAEASSGEQASAAAEDEAAGPQEDPKEDDGTDPSDDALLAAEAAVLASSVLPTESAAVKLPTSEATDVGVLPALPDQAQATGSGPANNANPGPQDTPVDVPGPSTSAVEGATIPTLDLQETAGEQTTATVVQTVQELATGDSVPVEIAAEATLDEATVDEGPSTGTASGPTSETVAASDPSADLQTGQAGEDSSAPSPSIRRKNGNRLSAAEQAAQNQTPTPDVGPVPPAPTGGSMTGDSGDSESQVSSITTTRTTSDAVSATTIRDGSSTDGAVGATSGTDASDQQTQVDRTRFVQRVARAFESLGDRGGTLRLRLSPPELGSMRLEIQVNDGVMTARMEAETQSAKDVILDNLPALKERLAQQDIRVERFDVDLMDHRSGGGQPDQSWQFAESRQRSPQQNQRESASSGASAKEQTSETGVSRVFREGTRLNVIV